MNKGAMNKLLLGAVVALLFVIVYLIGRLQSGEVPEYDSEHVEEVSTYYEPEQRNLSATPSVSLTPTISADEKKAIDEYNETVSWVLSEGQKIVDNACNQAEQSKTNLDNCKDVYSCIYARSTYNQDLESCDKARDRYFELKLRTEGYEDIANNLEQDRYRREYLDELQSISQSLESIRLQLIY